jgi:hypothetical protein
VFAAELQNANDPWDDNQAENQGHHSEYDQKYAWMGDDDKKADDSSNITPDFSSWAEGDEDDDKGPGGEKRSPKRKAGEGDDIDLSLLGPGETVNSRQLKKSQSSSEESEKLKGNWASINASVRQKGNDDSDGTAREDDSDEETVNEKDRTLIGAKKGQEMAEKPAMRLASKNPFIGKIIASERSNENDIDMISADSPRTVSGDSTMDSIMEG